MASRRRKRKCVRYGYRKEIQDYGPSKRRRYCKKFGAASSAKKTTKTKRRRGRKRTGWCVWRGKERVSCHRTKRVASKRATAVRRACKRKIKVRIKRAA